MTFPEGQDRVYVTETAQQTSPSRAPTEPRRGANFEVLIGFDVTPQMAAFNRDGKRFRAQRRPGRAGAAAGTTPTP